MALPSPPSSKANPMTNREALLSLAARVEAVHGPVSEMTLKSKPLKPDTDYLPGDGVYWWEGRHGMNAFGAPLMIFYTEKSATEFREALLRALAEKDQPND